MVNLTPHYKGQFEAFRDSNGEQYSRLQLDCGSYVWFKFDYLTESYQSFENEMFNVDGIDKTTLQKNLEESYQNLKDVHLTVPVLKVVHSPVTL